ncbi:MAG: hypothetical protein ACOXZJ_06865 [Bacteroidales bacterium]
MLGRKVGGRNAGCRNAGCRNAGCRNAGCRNAGCRNAGCRNAGICLVLAEVEVVQRFQGGRGRAQNHTGCKYMPQHHGCVSAMK